MRYLTKSRFTTAITCPSKLNYLDDPNYANLNSDNEFLMALAEGGHQVGALAKCLFPDGIEIDAIGHDAQVNQTNELLEREEVTLFEAAIRVGHLFVRVDLLRKQGNRFELFEVKAKSYDSREGHASIVNRNGISSEFKPYLYDVAFQRHVLRRALPEATILSYLVMPDKAKKCSEARLSQRLRIKRSDARSVRIETDDTLRDGVLARDLLYILAVDEFLDTLTQSELQAGGYSWAFADGVAELESRINGPAFDSRPGTHCRGCEFRTGPAHLQEGLNDGRMECLSTYFGASVNALASSSVFDLYNFRGTDSIVRTGRILLKDLESEDVKLKLEKGKISLSQRQWLQCEESRDAVLEPVIAIEILSSKLSSLKFPLHFIDFETATPPLPFHAGMHPYELLFFQFSHHQMESDGSVTHKTQYLDTRRDSFPNFDALRELSAAIRGDGGSVIHWWTHERTVLCKIREQLMQTANPPADRDNLVAFIEGLIGTDESPGRLIDLGQHVFYPGVFLPGTSGSSSIKKVLPALLNASASLRHRYGQATYGTPLGIPSLNFNGQAWVRLGADGRAEDPYKLLAGRFNETELDALEDAEEGHPAIANGGAAMIAYGLLQSDLLEASAREELVHQLHRYCELDTLAMVMAFEGLQELMAAAA